MEPKNTGEPRNTDIGDVTAFGVAVGVGYGTGALLHRHLVEIPQRVATNNLEAAIGIASVVVAASTLVALERLRKEK